MKRTFFYTVIVIASFLITNCGDDNYSEGRIETVNATDIKNETAHLNGKVEFVTRGLNAKIVRRGFVFDESASNLSANVRTQTFTYKEGYDEIAEHNLQGIMYDSESSEGEFSAKVEKLKPNTKYYAKAFFIMVYTNNDGKIVYSNSKARLRYYCNPDDYKGDFKNVYDVDIFYGNTIEFTTEQ